MRGEIICIGDELISGRVGEGNARYAMSRLHPLGLTVGAVVIVGDNAQDIAFALRQALGRADFVICCGGLGATDDDITARTAAEVFGLALTESQRMVANLRRCFQAMGLELRAETRKMAWLPDGAEILCATCAGFKLSGPDGRPVFFLPGVPREMRRLIDESVLPALLGRFGHDAAVLSRKLRVFGLEEAEVGLRLEGLAQGVAGASVGFYPVFPEVQVQLSVLGQDRPTMEDALDGLEGRARQLLGDHVVGGDDGLEEAVGRVLRARGLRLAVAESCTGGLIGHRLTSRPGSSDYFDRGLIVYSNQAKQELLGVTADTLERHGAVSAQCAAEMAQGARQRAAADLGLAVTGIAGPGGGSDEKPVGTVFFGLADSQGVRSQGYLFRGGRAMIKAQAAENALDWLRRYLADDAFVRGA